MFALPLVATLFWQPGAVHGVIPGMTESAVEARLREPRPLGITLSGFPEFSTVIYEKAGISVRYERGRVSAVDTFEWKSVPTP